MPFPVSRDALQQVLAATLARVVLPQLPGSGEQRLVEACIDLCLREALQRTDTAAVPDAHVGADIATLGDAAAAAPARRAAERRLLAFLGAEAGHYREFEARLKQAKQDLLQARQEVFPAPTPAALTAALRKRFPNDAGIAARNIKVVVGGQSKQTVLFDLVHGSGRCEPLVMRRDHPNSFVATTVVNEFPILAALAREGYQVPEPLWLETDSPHIPGPHLVMRQVAGSTAGNSFAVRPDLADKAHALFAETLGRLHAIPLEQLAIPGFAASRFGESSLLGNIDYWYQRYRADVDHPEPILEIGYAWLRGNARRGLQPPVLVHGELGFHNMMADDSRITAVLDWELTHVGSPAEDLGYIKDYVESVGPFDTFLDLYEKAGGPRPDPEALHYYELFKMIRNGGIYLSAIQGFNRGLNDNPMLPSICLALYSGYVERIDSLLRQVMGK